MAPYRLRDVTAEQRRRALDLAKQECGVGHIPDEKLTPMALFLMSSIADQCIGIAMRESTVIVTPPDAGPLT